MRNVLTATVVRMRMRSSAKCFLLFIVWTGFYGYSNTTPVLSDKQELFLRKIRSIDGCTALRLASYCADMLKIGSFKIKQTNEIAALQRILLQRNIGLCKWGEWAWKATVEECFDELITNYRLSSFSQTTEQFHKFWIAIFQVSSWCSDNILQCRSALRSATTGQPRNEWSL